MRDRRTHALGVDMNEAELKKYVAELYNALKDKEFEIAKLKAELKEANKYVDLWMWKE